MNSDAAKMRTGAGERGGRKLGIEGKTDSAAIAKLSDVVYARIAGGIVDGEYPVASKLPTEHDLAERFSVSRPIVREALARLRDSGIVVSRRGSGTYVRRAPAPADGGQAPLSSIADMRRCLEYRIGLEGEIAFHAAVVRPSGSDDDLAAAVRSLEVGMASDEIGVDDDLAFHFAIAHATNNRFWLNALTGAEAAIRSCMAITRNFALLGTRERLRALHDEHLEIFAAIEGREADAARAAMRRHLENAMRRAFEGTF